MRRPRSASAVTHNCALPCLSPLRPCLTSSVPRQKSLRVTLSQMRLRRPFAAGSTLGLFAHNPFETRAGDGLVFEPQLGRRAATALWGALIPLGLSAAAPGGKGAARRSAFNDGDGVNALTGHLKHLRW